MGGGEPPRAVGVRTRRGIVRNSRGALRPAITRRRDGDIAPYRHYTRALRTQNSHAHPAIAPRITDYARALRAYPVVRCRCVRTARVPWCGPVAVGRDVPIAPPRRIARCAAWHCAKFARRITHAGRD